jgi:hypothetical protein
MRIERKGKGILFLPENDTDKKLIGKMFNGDMRSRKVGCSARHAAGTMFCEFVKDCDFKPGVKNVGKN